MWAFSDIVTGKTYRVEPDPEELGKDSKSARCLFRKMVCGTFGNVRSMNEDLFDIVSK